MKVLVCNVGSTSLKFKLFHLPNEDYTVEAKIERVGSQRDGIYSYLNIPKGISIKKEKQSVPNYTVGIQMFLRDLLDNEKGAIQDLEEIEAIGFKTVLAKDYYGVHELSQEVLRAMEEYLVIAPAHNGPYLEAIRQFKELLPDTLLVGAFETDFHTTIPLERKLYAIPYEWYEEYGIQKMGYHGASHRYISDQVKAMAGKHYRLISCHLGGSCSLCAILDGQSVDTSFGLSLQTGIPHSNRVGELDSYIIPFLLDKGLSMEEILEGLEKQGGLLGISGVSGDIRFIQTAAEEGNPRAKLAINVFVNSIIRHIGSYYAELGGLDYLVFTGGIGENAYVIREKICDQLSHMGIHLDPRKNRETKAGGRISREDSPVQVYIIPTNEELIVAKKTYEYSRRNS